MSDFLRKLYDEEMSKTGSAEFASIMRALPRDELEDYLGLPKLGAEEQPASDEKKKMTEGPTKPQAKGQDVEPETNLHTKQAAVQRVLSVMEKLAVGGPTEPPLPDSEKGQLKVKQDAIHKDVQAGSPKKETVPVDHQGPGKEAVEVTRGDKVVTTTKTAMAWADDMGRKLAAAVKKAYGPEPDPAEQQGSTVDAREKAKVAMMAYQTTRSAPEHIKTAAIKMAGIKIAEKDEKYVVVPESWWRGQKGMARASRAGDTGLKSLLAKDELVGKRLKGQLGGLAVGAPAGAGVGALGGLLASLVSKGAISRGQGAGGGALIGAALGSLTGQGLGQMRADRQFLEAQGIRPTWGGLGRGRYTQEAAKKYLKD